MTERLRDPRSLSFFPAKSLRFIGDQALSGSTTMVTQRIKPENVLWDPVPLILVLGKSSH